MKNLIDKYLGENLGENLEENAKWVKADDHTKDLLYGAVSMTRYDGYDLTILNRDRRWIPVHGGTEMRPVRNQKEAEKILINYVDKLPDASKIKGDNKIRKYGRM